MTTWLIGLIRLYRYLISGFLGNCCRFEPSCSAYAIQAIEAFGCIKGSFLIVRRVLRCHPFHPGGWDPIKFETGTSLKNCHFVFSQGAGDSSSAVYKRVNEQRRSTCNADSTQNGNF